MDYYKIIIIIIKILRTLFITLFLFSKWVKTLRIFCEQ